MRSGRPRKLWERTARMLVRKANQNPHLTAENLQEDLADSGVVVHRSTVQRCLHRQDLHGRVSRRKPYLCPHHKIQHQKYSTEHLQKPDVFWKQVLWTDEVKIELFGHNQQRHVWSKKEQHFMKRTPCQLLSMGVDLSCFGVVLQPVAQETLHRWREEWIPLNTSKVWKQTSHHL